MLYAVYKVPKKTYMDDFKTVDGYIYGGYIYCNLYSYMLYDGGERICHCYHLCCIQIRFFSFYLFKNVDEVNKTSNQTAASVLTQNEEMGFRSMILCQECKMVKSTNAEFNT